MASQEDNQFLQMLMNILSPEAAIRDAAQKTFNQLLEVQTDQVIMNLLKLLRTHPQGSFRQIGVQWLRNRITDVNVLRKLSPQVLEQVKNELLVGIQSEQDPTVLDSLSICIGSLAHSLVSVGNSGLLELWPNLLPFLFKCTKEDKIPPKVACLRIFAELCTYQSGDSLAKYHSHLKEIFVECLGESQHLEVRLAGLQAVGGFMQVLRDYKVALGFSPLIPGMMKTLEVALQQDRDQDARTALSVLMTLAETHSSMFRESLKLAVSIMLSIAKAANISSDTRHYAEEFLVTLTQSKPSLMRKLPGFVEEIIPLLLNQMCTIEDNPRWGDGEKFDKDDFEYDIAEECLDRLAIALQGKTIAPLLFQLIPTMLGNEDWKRRYGGLMTIAVVGEGCRSFLAPHLQHVLGFVIPLFADAHPRVRWAACNTIGQLSTDFYPIIQLTYHATVLPHLINALDDARNPRTQAHAASAVINFCEKRELADGDKFVEILKLYDVKLLEKLHSLLSTSDMIVQEQAITAVAALASCLDNHFAPFYDAFMPLLKQILEKAITKEYQVLRGKALECSTIIGLAVDNKVFAKDAHDLMNYMLRLIETLEDDDPQVVFVLHGFARMCKCLEREFIPFLKFVMPIVLRAAALTSTCNTPVSGSEDQPEEKGWEYIVFGDRRIGFDTGAIEEKTLACNLIQVFVEKLEDGFFEYLEPSTKVIAQMLKFYYHDGARQSAALAVPCLLKCAKRYMEKNNGDMNYVIKIWNLLYKDLVAATECELDTVVLMFLAEAWQLSIDMLGPAALTDEQLARTVQLLIDLTSDYACRKESRTRFQDDPDFDEEEGARLDEELVQEEYVFEQFAEVIGKLFKHFGPKFIHSWLSDTPGQLLSLWRSFLIPQAHSFERRVAICVFDDLIEFGGPVAAKLFGHCMPALVEYIEDTEPAHRQAAVYGIGIAALKGGAAFEPYLESSLVRLKRVISHAEARSPKYTVSTDNAISALGHVLFVFSSKLNMAQELPLWINYLPCTSDAIEAPVIYSRLCDLFFSHTTIAVGSQGEHLPRLFHIFGTILGTKLVNEEVTKRILEILRQLKTSVPPNIIQHAGAQLSQNEQAKLTQALSMV